MEITIHNTSKIVELNGVPARVWEGTTRDFIKVHCYITRIAVAEGENQRQFEQELREVETPSPEVAAIPARLIL